MKPTYKKKITGANVPMKKTPPTQDPTTSPFFESAETNKHYNDRLDYLMVNSIGHTVTVTVSSGKQYSGILTAANLESNDGIDIVLHNPQSLDPHDTLTLDGMDNNLLIDGEDVMELELKGIDLSWNESRTLVGTPIDNDAQPQGIPDNNQQLSSSFKTDVDISGNNKPLRERELQKWVPDDLPLDHHIDNNDPLKQQILEDGSGSWDQFSVNEQKFGVKSTYDEHFYTTKINKNDPNYEQRLKEAQRLASEIESQGTSGNIHVAEDRGIIIDDSGMDEEDLYSGVDRRGDELLASLKKKINNNIPNATTNNKPNKYLPPTLRNQPHHMDPAIISSTTAKNSPLMGIPTPVQSPKIESSKIESPKVESPKINAKDTKQQPIKAESPKINAKDIKQQPVKAESPKILKEKDLVKASTQSPSIKKGNLHSVAPPPPPHDTVVSRAIHHHHPNNPARESPKPRIPLPSTKEAQIEELKKFSEKFKVPYDVPKDMVKKIEGKSSSSQSNKNGSNHTRRRNQGNFFGNKKSHTGNKKDLFNSNFNFFTKSKEIHDEEKEMEPFFIEKPYFTAPTWTGSVEESFKKFFPDEMTAIQTAQLKLQERQMKLSNGIIGTNGNMMAMNNGMAGMFAAPNIANGNMRMNAATGMMGFHAGGMNPMMNGFPGAGAAGMYVPFQPQPMFYPNPMMPMMGGAGAPVNGAGANGGEDGGSSPPSQTTSPHIPNVYMNTGAPFGYPGNVPPFHPMAAGAGGNNKQQYYRDNSNNNNDNERGSNNNNHNRYHGHHVSRNNNRN